MVTFTLPRRLCRSTLVRWLPCVPMGHVASLILLGYWVSMPAITSPHFFSVASYSLFFSGLIADFSPLRSQNETRLKLGECRTQCRP